MMMKSFFFLLLYALLTSVSLAETEKTKEGKAKPCKVSVIHAGHLLAVPGKPLLKEQTIVVRDKLIQKVLDGYVSSGNWAVANCDVAYIDLKDSYVLPGLIDAHAHLTFDTFSYDGNPYISEAERTVSTVVNAKEVLSAGYTTVRDVGSYGNSIFVVRNAINEQRLDGPLILAAGDFLSATGGHGDITGVNADHLAKNKSSGLCDGVESCRKAVRLQVRRGADLLKVHLTGSGGDEWGSKTAVPVFSDEEVASIVQTAKRLNRKVAAHAHGLAGIKQALKAGVHSVEHASFLDDEIIRLFKKQQTYMVTTLYVPSLLAKASAEGKSPVPLDKIEPFLKEYASNIVKAYRAGVNIVPGSDNGIIAHEDTAKELEALVQAGLPADYVVKASTLMAAQMLDLEDRIGSIKVGKVADIIATKGDFLNDISQLQQVHFVMHNGRQFIF